MNNKLVESFIERHSEWLRKVCINLTGDINSADDLMQEVYIKLLQIEDIDRIRFGNNDLNTYFVYRIAKNHHINACKAKKETYKEEITETSYDDVDSDFEFANDDLVSKINNELSEMEKDNVLWFDSILLKTYINEDHSMKSLSDHTGISVSTIFTSLKRIKNHLSASYCKDYEKIKKI